MPTAAQILDFLTGTNISNYLNVNTFLQNLTKAYLWRSLCKCVDNSTPVAVVPPTDPGTLPSLNPSPYVSLPSSTACFHQANLSPFVLPINQSAVSDNINAYQYNPTSVRQSASTVTSVGPGRTCAVRWIYRPITGAALQTYCIAMGVNSTYSQVVPVPSGTQIVEVDILDDPNCGPAASVGSGTTTLTFNTELFCGQAPGASSVPCCPPDPLLNGKVNAILNLAQSMQRFHVPFAYVPGLVHTGVSGTGSTAVSRLIGYLLNVTAHPATNMSRGGNPSYIFDMGWVSVSTSDGMIEEKRLTRINQLWFPGLGELATQFNFFLNPGVTINWTELQPESPA